MSKASTLASMTTGTTQTRWLGADQQRSWRAYIVGTTMLLERLDRELREAHGLALSEYEILVRLSECPQRTMRMAALADSMSYSRSRITHTVTRLEDAGLVHRTASTDDGRGVVAILTDKGYARLVEAAPTHVEGVRAHLVDLAGITDFAAVGRVFNRVTDHLAPEHAPEADIRTEA
jgi:DNA-binding MarR family transcriptional regulator